METSSSSRAAIDNRARQSNPQHAVHYQARGTRHGAVVEAAHEACVTREANSAEPSGGNTPLRSPAGPGK